MNKTLKVIVLILGIICTFILSFICYYFVVTSNIHFKKSKLTTNSYKIELLSENGNVFSEKTNQNKSYVKLEELKPYVKDCFIAVEDKRFYFHNGIDYKRIVGATLKNIKSFKLVQGGSTISQQLIKNTHLTSEKTIKRKLKEYKLTKEMENKLSKNEILEIYLNTIYFGKNSYGIEDASKTYFNKNAKDLTLCEVCCLAGIIKSPMAYSPIINYDNSISRKNLILNLMLEQNLINKDDYIVAKNETLVLSKNIITGSLADYENAVFQELESLDISGSFAYKDNVKIYTFLDEDLQKEISNYNLENTSNMSRQQIVINNKNAGVIAYYGKNSILKRCPASCVKPWLIYAPMINENLITESTIINDIKTNFNGYTPNNYGNKYYGNVTAKTALSKSLNVPAVKLLESFGIKNAIKYSKKMGLNLEDDGLSMALGSIKHGLTLKELANCYLPFTNNGNYIESSFINKIEVNGKVVYKKNNRQNNVFSKQTTYIINDILKDCVLNGTSQNLKSLPFTVYGKTGTNGNSNGNLDAYSVAYTSNHTIVCWLGNEDNTLLPLEITGGTYPAIYNRETLKRLYKNNIPEEIKMPNDIIEKIIDEDTLLKEQKTYLSNDVLNGKPYFYIKGTEPTEYKTIELPQISNVKISVKSNLINFIINSKNCDKIEIYEIFSNQIEKIYCGDYVKNFSYKPTKYGKAYYIITPIKNNIKGNNYTTSSIKIISKTDSYSKGNKWLYE